MRSDLLSLTRLLNLTHFRPPSGSSLSRVIQLALRPMSTPPALHKSTPRPTRLPSRLPSRLPTRLSTRLPTLQQMHQPISLYIHQPIPPRFPPRFYQPTSLPPHRIRRQILPLWVILPPARRTANSLGHYPHALSIPPGGGKWSLLAQNDNVKTVVQGAITRTLQHIAFKDSFPSGEQKVRTQRDSLYRAADDGGHEEIARRLTQDRNYGRWLSTLVCFPIISVASFSFS